MRRTNHDEKFRAAHVIGTEPLLVAGVSAFWLVTLSFVAAFLVGVKIWDALAVRPADIAPRIYRAVTHAHVVVGLAPHIAAAAPLA